MWSPGCKRMPDHSPCLSPCPRAQGPRGGEQIDVCIFSRNCPKGLHYQPPPPVCLRVRGLFFSCRPRMSSLQQIASPSPPNPHPPPIAPEGTTDTSLALPGPHDAPDLPSSLGRGGGGGKRRADALAAFPTLLDGGPPARLLSTWNSIVRIRAFPDSFLTSLCRRAGRKGQGFPKDRPVRTGFWPKGGQVPDLD